MSGLLDGPYAGFILGAYGITFAVLVGLVIWVLLTATSRKRQMVKLEEEGVRRRSAQGEN